MAEEAAKMEDLIDERAVEGYTVRKWSLGQIVELSPTFEEAAKVCAQRRLSVAAIAANPMALILAVTPWVPRILAVTLGRDESEMRALPGDKAVTLALVVLELNLAYLKNLFGPIVAAMLLELSEQEEKRA